MFLTVLKVYQTAKTVQAYNPSQGPESFREEKESFSVLRISWHLDGLSLVGERFKS
jgi:hypothetical protein